MSTKILQRQTNRDPSPVGVRRMRPSNMDTSLTHRSCQYRLRPSRIKKHEAPSRTREAADRVPKSEEGPYGFSFRESRISESVFDEGVDLETSAKTSCGATAPAPTIRPQLFNSSRRVKSFDIEVNLTAGPCGHCLVFGVCSLHRAETAKTHLKFDVGLIWHRTCFYRNVRK